MKRANIKAEDFTEFYPSLKEVIDLEWLTKDMDIKYFLLIEKDGKHRTCSNKLPVRSLALLFADLFHLDPEFRKSTIEEYEKLEKQLNDTDLLLKDLKLNQIDCSSDYTQEEKEASLEALNRLKKIKKFLESESDTDQRTESEERDITKSIKEDKKPDDMLTAQDLQELYGISYKTLANWRSQHKGPEYFKLGNRVMYRRDKVDEWIEKSQMKMFKSKTKESD